MTVVEVAQLGMSALGGYLADMGAKVIKVEAIPDGDPVRFAGEHAVGGPEGFGFLHLRWNRGKQSIGLDLRSDEGIALFRKLATSADIVIEGLKAGSLDRLGIGYSVLQKNNPTLVFCSISGLGGSGPYHRMRSHASAYDAYAGLLPKDVESRPPTKEEFKAPSVGMNAPGLYAAIGVLSALHRARSEGIGAEIEVAAIDAATNFAPDQIDPAINPDTWVERPGHLDKTSRMREWPRLWFYETLDGKILHLEALADETWEKFCALVERTDLLSLRQTITDDETYNETLQRELTDLIKSRSLNDWMANFVEHDISAMPVNASADLRDDPTYTERKAWYEKEIEGAGTLRLSGTPIRVEGQAFNPSLAPALGEHTDFILHKILDVPEERMQQLRDAGVVA